MKFDEKIKNIRKENNLTQEELAKKLFVSRSAIAKWEQGRGLPSLDLLERISKTFNIRLDDLINDEDMKQITINNHDKIIKLSRYKIIIFIAVFAIFIMSIALIILSVGLDKKSSDKDSEPNEVDYNDYVIVERIFADYSIRVLKKSNGKTNSIDIAIDLKETTIYNKYGVRTKYTYLETIKEGYYLNVKYTYYKEDDINIATRIEIIEDYISDYEVYGFFVSTSEVNFTQPPINLPPFYYFNEEENGYQYDDHQGLGSTFVYPHHIEISDYSSTGSGISKKSDAIFWENVKTDRIEWNDFFKEESYEIDISDSVSGVYLYVIDNSYRGYQLLGFFDKQNNIRKIEAHIQSPFFSNNILNSSDAYKYPKYETIIYNIKINFVKTAKSITIYEYDIENNLIKEKRYNSYEDYYFNYKGLDGNAYYTRLEIEYDENTLILDTRVEEQRSTNVRLATKYGYATYCNIKLI